MCLLMLAGWKYSLDHVVIWDQIIPGLDNTATANGGRMAACNFYLEYGSIGIAGPGSSTALVSSWVIIPVVTDSLGFGWPRFYAPSAVDIPIWLPLLLTVFVTLASLRRRRKRFGVATVERARWTRFCIAAIVMIVALWLLPNWLERVALVTLGCSVVRGMHERFGLSESITPWIYDGRCMAISVIAARGAYLVLRLQTACPSQNQPLCGGCNYNLTGNVSGRCPECGTATRWMVEAS